MFNEQSGVTLRPVNVLGMVAIVKWLLPRLT
jgi:hypothetical protein